jgi:hypothetical protein
MAMRRPATATCVGGQDLRDLVSETELVWIGRLAKGFNLAELLLAEFVNVFV